MTNTTPPETPGAHDALDLTLLIPVYNEEGSVAETIERAVRVLRGMEGTSWEIIAIDDGSSDGSRALLEQAVADFAAEREAAGGDAENVGTARLRLLARDDNGGYGAALKWGFSRSAGELVAMTDADGTYPVERLPELVERVRGGAAEMAVGARTGANVAIPIVRRPAKWFLRKFANWLVQARIPDLNSGLRVIRRGSFATHQDLLPNGFSLTTTITLALHASGAPVVYLPIDYEKRVGTSSIRPIRDTAKFLGLIVRTMLLFNPLRVFGPASVVLMGSGIAVAIVTKLFTERMADVSSIVLFLSGMQMLALGLLAELIIRRR